jgi:hypothetical protein
MSLSFQIIIIHLKYGEADIWNLICPFSCAESVSGCPLGGIGGQI